MVHLEASCQSGDCSLPLRDQAVNAVNNAALYAGTVSPLVIQDEALVVIAAALGSHTASSDILSDLADLSSAVIALEDEVCTLSGHMPVLQWTPAYSATLVGQPAEYTLDLTNEGSLPTSYALTVTLPAGSQTFSPSLDPGQSATFHFPISSAITGLYDLEADVGVVGHDFIQVSSLARINVVDRFIQITSVNPDPPFVETGVSSTTISVNVANIANMALPATAHTAILAPGGATAYSADAPVTLLAGAPRDIRPADYRHIRLGGGRLHSNGGPAQPERHQPSSRTAPGTATWAWGRLWVSAMPLAPFRSVLGRSR